MGGADSAVDDATTDIFFLESAFFAPGVIVGSPVVLASARIPLIVSSAAWIFAATQADWIVHTIDTRHMGAGRRSDRGVRRASGAQSCKLRLGACSGVLVLRCSGQDRAGKNRRLQVFQRQGDEFLVTPPSYRFDITIEKTDRKVARVYA